MRLQRKREAQKERGSPASSARACNSSPATAAAYLYCVPCSILRNIHTIQGLLQRLEASKSRFSAPVESASRSHETRVGCKARQPLDANSYSRCAVRCVILQYGICVWRKGWNAAVRYQAYEEHDRAATSAGAPCCLPAVQEPWASHGCQAAWRLRLRAARLPPGAQPAVLACSLSSAGHLR